MRRHLKTHWLLYRQGKEEGTASANFALHPESPPLHLHQALRNRQPKPGACGFLPALCGDLVELLEDVRCLFRGNARTSVCNRDLHPGIAASVDGDGDCTMGWGKLDRIANQVHEHLRHL